MDEDTGTVDENRLRQSLTEAFQSEQRGEFDAAARICDGILARDPKQLQSLVLTGRILRAEEAARIGLVNKVVPGDTLLKEAREMATQMVEARPEVLAAAKRALTFGASHSMSESMKNEQALGAEPRQKRTPEES